MTSSEIREIAGMCIAIVAATLRAVGAEAKGHGKMDAELKAEIENVVRDTIANIAEDSAWRRS
jgi:hypothetical protein